MSEEASSRKSSHEIAVEYEPNIYSKIVIDGFVLENGEYIETDGELVYPLGETSFTRPRGVAADSCREITNPPTHFNGAENASYQQSKYEWWEVGPEREQPTIEECVDSEDEEGRCKSVVNRLFRGRPQRIRS